MICPIKPSRSYVILVTSYMARGKEGYGPLKAGEHTATHSLIADVLIDYLRKAGLATEAA